MGMYRSYLLKKGFNAEKKSNKKVYTQHNINVGGIYAVIVKEGDAEKGVEITVDKIPYYIDNFDKLDIFLAKLQLYQSDFMHILKVMERKLISKSLRHNLL